MMSRIVPPSFIPCPHCHIMMHPSQLASHLRDTGSASLRPKDGCVVLFDLRNSHREVNGA